jgi:hypothetical protein
MPEPDFGEPSRAVEGCGVAKPSSFDKLRMTNAASSLSDENPCDSWEKRAAPAKQANSVNDTEE